MRICLFIKIIKVEIEPLYCCDLVWILFLKFEVLKWRMKLKIFLTKQINGSANFFFNDEEMKKVMEFSDGPSEHMYLSSPGPVEILATVTESLTGL